MADKAPTAMPPASEPFPGSRTPGWNDPPTLAYNSISVTSSGGPSRRRINLNKRVAYPLQGAITANSSKPTAVVLPNQASAGLPPPAVSTIMQPVAVVHPMPHTSSEQENIDLPTDAMTTSFRYLRDQVPLVQESVNIRREEIERRLGIIEQLWQTGNLSTSVQQKIYGLSEAVENRSYNEAMEIYTSLVANHANECASWAVTLRHIVLTIPTNGTVTIGSDAMINMAAPNTSNNAHISNIHGSNNTVGSSNLFTSVPTMSVTAMPRSSTEAISPSPPNPTVSSIPSRVQHI